jgi:hypothetical protein
MESEEAEELFKLIVLSPGGRDLEQYFDRPAEPDSPAHPPVNFHGFAASTRGAFHRDPKRALVEKGPVLILLRGDFKASQLALTECKKQKRTVAVSFKETGLHQIAEQLTHRGRLGRFLQIAAEADGCIATTPEAAGVFRQARGKLDPATVAFIPTPYPLEDTKWNLSIPPDKQSGILVGTREWNVPSRNHAAALLMARRLSEATKEPVTVFNLNGRKGGKLLAAMKFPEGKLRILDKRKPYAEYVREVTRHKIVLQLDRSRVPGQVAGDCLLARTLCVGGDGAIERIAFPNFCGAGRTLDQIYAIALELLQNANVRATAIVESQWRAMERLSFRAGRTQLENFFTQLANPSFPSINPPAV